MMRTLLADAVLAVHFALAAFIVLGLFLIWIGAFTHWAWVRNFWFRLAHLAAIVVVALEALLGIACPLTVWEDALRQVSGQPSFIARWLRRVLFYDLPSWVFTTAYVGCALATLAAWCVVPPRRPARPSGPNGGSGSRSRSAATGGGD